MGKDIILDEELCNKISQSASLIIGHDVLITNAKAIVIASSDRSRIGTLHAASLDVIASGKEAYHNKLAASRLAGTRPGMTSPIFVGDKAVGTFGITGKPEEISKYVMLIQQQTQLFLNFQNRQQTMAGKDHQKQNLLRSIITFDKWSGDLNSIQNNAYELQIDLNVYRAAIIVNLMTDEKDTKDNPGSHNRISSLLLTKFDNRQDFVCALNDTEYVILAVLPVNRKKHEILEDVYYKCRASESELKEKGICAQLGIGPPADSVESLRVSYNEARLVIRIMEMRKQNGCMSIDDVFLEKLAISIPDELSGNINSPLFENVMNSKERTDVLHVVDSWCRQRFNFAQTANDLHIHKSTLVYRFERIKERYGIDLYDFDKAMTLYLLNIKKNLLETK